MRAVTAPLFRANLGLHPATNSPSVVSVRADVFRDGEGLRIAFEFCGALERLSLPQARLDPAKLWEHTCAELFVAGEDGRYVEWNFSPTGQVARFEFSDYRERSSASFDEDVKTSVRENEQSVHLVASGSLLRGVDRIASASLSAVVRAPDDVCSYWALKHPRAEPDFHDRRGFILDGGLLSR